MADKRVRRWCLLTAILLVAAVFRICCLHTMPWGLSQDEVGNADISLGLLRGGHALFLAGGFGHEPLFHYLQAVTIALFGDNVVGIRMPAVASGMVLVAASYALLRRWFGSVVALTAATGLALSWWPVVFSRVGIRAITFPLTLTLCAYFLTRAIQSSSGWAFALGGVFLGATFYTYTASRIVLLMVPVILVYCVLFQRPVMRREWRGLLLALCVTVVIAAPLAIYLRARPELDERVGQLGGVLEALSEGDFAPLWHGVRDTLRMFSRDSDARWTYGIPSRPVLGTVGGMLFYLGLALAFARGFVPAYGVSLIWLLVALVPGVLAPQAPSTIRVIGALPVVYAMVGVAVAWVWHRVRLLGHVVRFVVAAGLALLALGSAAWTYRDGFVTWAGHRETYWLYKSHFADIARFLDRQSAPLPAVVFEPWVEPVDVNGLRRDLVHDDREPRWVQGGRAFVWPAGTDRFLLAMPIFSAANDDIWRLFAGDPAVASRSSFTMPDGRSAVTVFCIEVEPTLSEFLAGSSHLSARSPEDLQAISLPADLGGQLSFLGHAVLSNSISEGELRVVTLWRVERSDLPPIALFVHMLGPDGSLLTQHDGFDVWVGSLRPGDTVAQLHTLPVDSSISPGLYRVEVGAYTRGDGRRLPVYSKGAAVADRLVLDELEVGP